LDVIARSPGAKLDSAAFSRELDGIAQESIHAGREALDALDTHHDLPALVVDWRLYTLEAKELREREKRPE
jgi:hypothetical protein